MQHNRRQPLGIRVLPQVMNDTGQCDAASHVASPAVEDMARLSRKPEAREQEVRDADMLPVFASGAKERFPAVL